MRSLEAFVASEAAGAWSRRGLAPEAIVWTAPSTPTSPTWPGRPVRCAGGGVERAGTLLRTTAALLHLAESNDLWLVGIGKTQRAGLSPTPWRPGPAPGVGNRRWGFAGWPGGGAPEGERLGDGELLAIAPAGWSWPLVLDGTRFPLLSQPPARHSAIARPSSPATCAPTPPTCPCGWTSPPAPWAWTIASCRCRRPALAGLGARPQRRAPGDRGRAGLLRRGTRLQRPPYAVDRLVRLSRRDVEARYLPMCARVAGLPLDALTVDRGGGALSPPDLPPPGRGSRPGHVLSR